MKLKSLSHPCSHRPIVNAPPEDLLGWDPTRVSRRQRFDDPRDASKKISGAWIGLCASGDCQLLVGFGHHTACFIAKTGTRSKCPPSSLAFTHDCHPVRYLNPRFGLKGPLGRVLAFLVHGAHCSSPLVAEVDSQAPAKYHSQGIMQYDKPPSQVRSGSSLLLPG